MSLSADQHTELLDLLDLLAWGEIDQAQLTRLERLVVENRDARECYLADMELRGGLEWLCRDSACDLPAAEAPLGQHASAALPMGEAGSPVADQSLQPDKFVTTEEPNQTSDSASGPVVLGFLKTGLNLAAAWLSSPKMLALGVAGALLTYFAVLGISLVISRLHAGDRDGLPRSAQHVASFLGIARLSEVTVCIWNTKDAQRPDSNIKAGQSLELREGVAEIRFSSGVTLAVEGPCLLGFESLDRLRLNLGKLEAVVPHGAEGFTVATPSATIVDLGTEFGADVTGPGQTDVEVFRGQVRIEPRSNKPLEPRDPGAQPTDRQPAPVVIRAGESRQITVNPTTGRATVRPPRVAKRFVRKLAVPIPLGTMVSPEDVVVDDSGPKFTPSILRSNFDPAADDLLQRWLDPGRGVAPPLETVGTFPGQRLESLLDGRLYDMEMGGAEQNTSNSFSPSEGQSIEFNFDTARAPLGFDIAGIESFTGWMRNRLGQRYAVFVRFRGHDAFEERPLASVDVPWSNDGEGGAFERKVTVQTRGATCLASGVEAIRFVFHDTSTVPLPGSVYREIDVLGVPSSRNR